MDLFMLFGPALALASAITAFRTTDSFILTLSATTGLTALPATLWTAARLCLGC